jgi:hypothetical protein
MDTPFHPTGAVMSIYELDIAWAETANERRYLRWELLACEDVRGVFLTAREDTLAVLFDGDRRVFRDWARSLTTTREGATAETSRPWAQQHRRTTHTKEES